MPGVRIVSFEDLDGRGSAEDQDPITDTVEEVTVVADNEAGAAEVDESFLEDAQGLEVEVIGRFIEDEEIPAAAQNLSQQHPVALAAREVADAVIDARVGEEEALEVTANREFFFTELDEVFIAPDLLEDAEVIVELQASLVDVIVDGFFPQVSLIS